MSVRMAVATAMKIVFLTQVRNRVFWNRWSKCTVEKVKGADMFSRVDWLPLKADFTIRNRGTTMARTQRIRIR